MLNFNTFLEMSNPRHFYHGTKRIFPIGFILKPQTEGYVHYPETKEIEALFEKYRPKNKISRTQSVFMVSSIDDIDSAGGYLDYVYEVQPIGQIDISDLSWYSEASIFADVPGQNMTHSTEEEIKPYILNYWNGVPFKDKKHSLFEYRAKSAKIISLVHTE